MLQNKSTVGSGTNFIGRIGASLTRWSMKYMPDPSIFAVVLTLIALILGILVAKQDVLSMIKYWYKGLWELLGFAMQKQKHHWPEKASANWLVGLKAASRLFGL